MFDPKDLDFFHQKSSSQVVLTWSEELEITGREICSADIMVAFL